MPFATAGVRPSGKRCSWGSSERVDWAFQLADARCFLLETQTFALRLGRGFCTPQPRSAASQHGPKNIFGDCFPS